MDKSSQSIYKKVISLAAMKNFDTNGKTLSLCRLLASGRGTAENLSALISLSLEGIPVDIQEFSPAWVEVSGLKSLGGCRLGQDSLLGSRIYDFTGKFRIKIGPLGPENFNSFLPGSSSIKQIREITDSFMTSLLDYDIEISIKSQDLDQVILGSRTAALGHTSLLGKPSGRLQSIVHKGR